MQIIQEGKSPVKVILEDRDGVFTIETIDDEGKMLSYVQKLGMLAFASQRIRRDLQIKISKKVKK